MTIKIADYKNPGAWCGIIGEAESMNKHKAVKHEYRGMKFDSGRELKRWKELEILEAAGKIKFLHRQVPYVLAKSVVLSHRRKPALRYVADFVYYCNERGRQIVEDAKSPHIPDESGISHQKLDDVRAWN